MSALQQELREALRAELKALLAEQNRGLVDWAEAAKYLDISIRLLEDLAKREGFTIVRVTDGGPRKLKRAELEAFIERRAERKGPEAA